MRRPALAFLPALAQLFVAATAGPCVAAGRDAAAPPAKTGKERQGGKAFDEQRVDDCKVPPAHRTHPRPTECFRGARG